MNFFRSIRQRIRSMWQNRAVKQEIDEELRFHLEQRTAANVAAGMSPKEAAREARRRFGNLQNIREDCRDVRGTSFGGTVWQDVQFGLRLLWKNPGFTAIAVLTLALGIGINTSMYSALKLLIFHPLPFPESDRIVRVLGKTAGGDTFFYHTAPDFFESREQSVAVEHLSAIVSGNANLSGNGVPPENVDTRKVTADFFVCLGISPILGKVFDLQNEQPSQDQVVLLTRSFWKRRFAGNTNIIGQPLLIDGKSVTVMGVIPDTIEALFFGMPTDVVQPLSVGADQRKNRENQWIEYVIGRLKPGVSVSQAQAEWKIINTRPERFQKYRLELIPLARACTGGNGAQIFWMLLGMTGFVLLIACANLANLQLSRMVLRSRELGIRAALGAGRGRLARQLLTESLLLSLLGGAVGFLLAIWCNHFLGNHLNIDRTSYNVEIPIDRSIIFFALFISLATGILIGTAPAWLMVRADVNPALKDGVRSSGSHSRHRLQNTLIVAEISIAVLLLSCTGELTFAIFKESRGETGWNPTHLQVANVMLTGPEYDSAEKTKMFIGRLQQRLANSPGVKDVSICSGLPFETECGCWRVVAEGQAQSDMTAPVLKWNFVDQHYFKTLEMPLRQGRNFAPEEIDKNAAVVIINQALADRLWPGQNPIGKRISYDSKSTFWMQVVGVVPNVCGPQDFRGYRPPEKLDLLTIAMRATIPPDALASTVRHYLTELDPNLPVKRFHSATKILEEYSLNEKTITMLIGAFGGLGMLLATIGVYGVTSQLVSQRCNEFAIRMALGAQRSNVLWLILKSGLLLSLIGALLGIFGSVGGLRLLISVLSDQIDSTSATWLGLPAPAWIATAASATILVAVALVACWLPSRRATRIDPMAVLRCE